MFCLPVCVSVVRGICLVFSHSRGVKQTNLCRFGAATLERCIFWLDSHSQTNTQLVRSSPPGVEALGAAGRINSDVMMDDINIHTVFGSDFLDTPTKECKQLEGEVE